jgi:hypothetical protein
MANGKEWRCRLADYLALPAVSSGSASDFIDSPALYHAKHVAMTIDHDETSAMLLGSAVHCLVLEGREEFNERYAIGPCDDKRTTKWKNWVASYDGNRKGPPFGAGLDWSALTASQGATVEACLEAILRHDDACEALFSWPGEPEVSGTWNDDETGLLCKLRFDRLCREHHAPIELKTSRSADPDTVQRTAVSMGYHRRAAWYTEGYRSIYGVTPMSLPFITVATELPPSVLEDRVYVWTIDSVLEELGHRDNRTALNGIAAARASGVWRASWSRGVHTVSAPSWMARAI